MSPLVAVAVPLAFALVAFALPSNRWRPALLPIAAVVHLAVVALLAAEPSARDLGGWVELDALAKLVALTVAVLFLACALYAPAYLRVRSDRKNRLLCGGLLVMVAMLTLVAQAQHFGLLWVGLEATTLAAAPLLSFNQTPRSLEAAWKFLLMCSVGIALALFGSFFLAYAALKGGQEPSLLLADIVLSAPSLSVPWLHAAFVTVLVGYGTKMGLAPMHAWKPDAYGEAPGLLAAMLAGGVTSGACVAILRFLTVVHAAGEGAFAGPILIGIGLLSMAFAAVFMTRQKDIKRMLAYSSVEHMGVLVLGAGIGGAALFGALLHLVANALTKGVLFLAAGNVHRAFGSKSTDEVAGALLSVPASAALLLAGFLALAGAPPFLPFVSELTIVRAAFGDGRHVVAGATLALMLWAFLGMGSTVLAAVLGEPPARRPEDARETSALVLPIALLLAIVLVLGVWLPEPLRALLSDATANIEGGR